MRIQKNDDGRWIENGTYGHMKRKDECIDSKVQRGIRMESTKIERTDQRWYTVHIIAAYVVVAAVIEDDQHDSHVDCFNWCSWVWCDSNLWSTYQWSIFPLRDVVYEESCGEWKTRTSVGGTMIENPALMRRAQYIWKLWNFRNASERSMSLLMISSSSFSHSLIGQSDVSAQWLMFWWIRPCTKWFVTPFTFIKALFARVVASWFNRWLLIRLLIRLMIRLMIW